MRNDTLIIIPAYNESANIVRVVEGLLRLPLDADILVVNDGSTDHTLEIAKNLPVFVVNHSCNLGYGAALKTGYTFARFYDYKRVIQFDGDGQHNPLDILPILNRMKEGYDVVIGSRFLGEPNFSPGLAKLLVMRFFRLFIFSVSGLKVTDPTSGLRGLCQAVFVHYAENCMASDYPDADLLVEMRLLGFSICEVPISNQKRLHGRSMHSGIQSTLYIWKVILAILVVLVHCKLHRKKISE